jgi:hypothetical protein
MMPKDYTNAPPEGWKNFDLFVVDMNTYRLPPTDALAGRELALDFDGSAMALRFDKTSVAWISGDREGRDEYEAINVAPDVYFVSFPVSATNTECDALIFNTETRRAVHVHNWTKPEAKAGEPRIGQRFVGGRLAGGEASGVVPHRTKELTGMKAIYTYSEDHDYEHYYTTSKYFCWKGLSGAQKGDAATEPAEYWKFADGQYVFGWTEMIIPCSPIWFICFDGSFGDNRETGVFCNTNPDGTMRVEPAGALIQKISQTFYPNRYEKL